MIALRILAVLVVLVGLYWLFVCGYMAMRHPQGGYPSDGRIGYGLYAGVGLVALLVSAAGIVLFIKARSVWAFVVTLRKRWLSH